LVEVFVPAFSAQVSFGKLSARERTMHLTINGEEKQVPDQLTVLQLLQHLQITGPVAVERNQSIVPRAQHGTAALKDGDQLEIVHFVGGG
jgi:sulfur carrier protein